MILSLRILNRWRKKSGAAIGATGSSVRSHEEIWKENDLRRKKGNRAFRIFLLVVIALWVLLAFLWA